MNLKWGTGLIELCELDGGFIPTPEVWIQVDTPVKDSTKLTAAEGGKREALEEGGGVVDTYREKNKLTFEFELFAKKDVQKPIEDDDGRIVKNYAIRFTPEDPMNKGFIIPYTSGFCSDSFDMENGEKWKYTFDALVPLDGGRMRRDYYGVMALTRMTEAISDSGATFNGEYTTKGTVTAVGFSYKEKASASATWTDLPASGTATPFTQNVTGLTPNTNYEVKAFVEMGGSRYEGKLLSFRTLPV